MKHLKDIDIKNKSVLIRMDYNVPIRNNKIIDSFRIDSSIETIQHCLDRGCKVSYAKDELLKHEENIC